MHCILQTWICGSYFGQLFKPVFFQINLKNSLLLTILTGKDWCLTQFSTAMVGWLLLIFLMCFHNQLSSTIK